MINDSSHYAPSMLKIAEMSDVNLIRSIAYNTWYHTYGAILTSAQITYMLEELYSELAISNLISKKEQEFLMVYKADLAVGFAACSVLSEEVLKLCKIYVLPEAQGFGLGDKLMNAIKEKAIRGGHGYIELNVNRSNNAINYYKKHGFQIVKEADVPIGPYWMNDYIMRCAV